MGELFKASQNSVEHYEMLTCVHNFVYIVYNPQKYEKEEFPQNCGESLFFPVHALDMYTDTTRVRIYKS